MKTIMMAIVCAMTVFAMHSNAYALTLKSGEVLASEGGVKQAHETRNGQAQLEKDGYLVAAGQVAVDIEGHVVVIPLTELAGKSTQQIAEVIGGEVAAQLSDEELASVAGISNAVADAAGAEIAADIAQKAAEALAAGDVTQSIAEAYAEAVASGEIHDAASDQAWRDANIPG